LLGGLGHLAEAILLHASLDIAWHLLEAFVERKLSSTEFQDELFVALEHVPVFLELVLGQLRARLTIDQSVELAWNHEVEDVQGRL